MSHFTKLFLYIADIISSSYLSLLQEIVIAQAMKGWSHNARAIILILHCLLTLSVSRARFKQPC